MPKYPRVREQSIAVFGESGSGKTVMLSSFYGRTQDGSYANDLWDLIALKTGQGHRLYQNYLCMRDDATAPMTDRFANTTYEFSVKLKSRNDPEVKRRPFDELRLSWHDYPGEWFEQDPSTDEENDRRTDTFRSLLRSDVALLLVDGQKLIDYRDEEQRYLKALLGGFRQNLERLGAQLLDDGAPIVEFPRIWVLALSKADLHPTWSVDTFRDLIIKTVASDVERLRDAIAHLIATPEALSVGEDFLLISSAKFELTSTDCAPLAIDLNNRIGLDLILPIASLLPLARRVQWEARLTIPRIVLESLADGADSIARALSDDTDSSKARNFVKKVLPHSNRADVFMKLMPALAVASEMTGSRLRQINKRARSVNDHLRAMVTQFKIDLEEGEKARVIRIKK